METVCLGRVGRLGVGQKARGEIEGRAGRRRAGWEESGVEGEGGVG